MGMFYVLIAWGFHPESESANRAACEQDGYICGTWHCGWPSTKQISRYHTIGNKMGSANEAHVAAWKGTTICEITENKTLSTDLSISRLVGGTWELKDVTIYQPMW